MAIRSSDTDYGALSIWEEITFKGSVPKMKERSFCQMSIFNPEFLLLLQLSTQSSPLRPPSSPLSSSVRPHQPYSCLRLHHIQIAKAVNNSYITTAFPWRFSACDTPQKLSHRKFSLLKNVIPINFLVSSKIINHCCSWNYVQRIAFCRSLARTIHAAIANQFKQNKNADFIS